MTPGRTRPKAPIRLTIDDTVIQLLEVPPLQVYAVLRDRARVQLDIAFIDRIAIQRGWNQAAVSERYCHGVDWEFIRAHLRSPALTPTKKRALQVLASGASWSDERRWLAGYQVTPECNLCHDAVGDDTHFFVAECEAVQVALTWERLAGNPHKTPPEFDVPALAPLAELGLPPRARRWRPVPAIPEEGHLTMGGEHRSYGDGSGFRQQSRVARVATWAVARLNEHESCSEYLRGGRPRLLLDRPARRDHCAVEALAPRGAW